MIKGLVVTAVQLALVLSVGAKFTVDRATLPRVWVKTAPFDPSLPIRGRYVSMALAVDAQGFKSGAIYVPARLAVEQNRLVARPDDAGKVMVTISGDQARLSEAVDFFIPEHVPDPSRRAPGEELWVEVSVPRQGPPRPIQLGVKKDGVLTPLDLR